MGQWEFLYLLNFVSHLATKIESSCNFTTLMAETESVCPVCGTFANTGDRSCCATGGAWFQKCGTTDDSDAEHTWTEGIQACKEPNEAPRTWVKR